MDPDRRSLLTAMLGGMALLGPDEDVAAEQQGEAPDPSVYIPKAHLVQDRSFLHAFMDEFSFVDLVSTTPTLRITHIPSVLDRATGRYGTIVGHISAQNEQVQAIRAGARAVVVFRGPHGYVSPGWLTTPAEAADVFSDYETVWKTVCGRIGRKIIAPNIPAERLPLDPELN